nr:hypothetical protein GCM10020092_075210 [Actinoplanes digitatis]
MPSAVRTPVTRGTRECPSVARPVTVTPRRIVTPAASAAADSTASSTGSAGGHGVEPLVAGADRTTPFHRQRLDQVHLPRARRPQRVPGLRKQLPHLLPPPRQHEMRQPELVDTAPLPVVPGGVGVRRWRRPGRVAFDDDHLVPVARQQHRRGKTTEARTEDQYPCHIAPPSNSR